jgi:hypothetical protein
MTTLLQARSKLAKLPWKILVDQQQPHRQNALGLQHSPWPLFCSDLALARRWLLRCWQQSSIPLPRQLAHWGLSLGLVDDTQRLCHGEHAQIDDVVRRQLGFRLARLQQHDNPYLALMDQTSLEVRAELLRKPSADLVIGLLGGLGDQLQLISQLQGWRQERPKRIRLETSPNRLSQLERTLAGHSWIELGAWTRPLARYPLLQLDASAALWSLGVRQHRRWLQPAMPTAGPVQQLLCCWRAEGRGDAFSAWSRSVPLSEVMAFYRGLLQSGGWQPQQFIDISHWRPWEQHQLQALGVTLHDPSKGDVLDLAQLAYRGQVLTIDTALAHLCAAMGHGAMVLLPRFADERWHELLRPDQCYHNHLQVILQQQFGCWQATLKAVSKGLIRQQHLGSTHESWFRSAAAPTRRHG